MEDDLGAEMECGTCYSDMTIPETWELVTAHNKAVKEAHTKAQYTGKYRIMIVDECGSEQCLYNDIPEELKDVVLAGVRAQYVEAREVFAEEEENNQYRVEMTRLHGEGMW